MVHPMSPESSLLPPHVNPNLFLRGSPQGRNRHGDRNDEETKIDEDRNGEEEKEESNAEEEAKDEEEAKEAERDDGEPYDLSNPPSWMDVALFNKISTVLPHNPSADILTETAIRGMQTAELRDFCKQNKYRSMNSRGNPKDSTISISGNRDDMRKRIVAWSFALYRQRKADPSLARPLSTSTRYTDEERARLIQMMSDVRFASTRQLMNGVATRGELDASNSSPSDEIWASTYAPAYNDFVHYVLPHLFPNDAHLRVFNPKHHTIPRRGADSLKTEWANLRSLFTIAYRNWGQSGQMDPETFQRFICESREHATEEEINERYFLVFMFKVIGHDVSVLNQTLRAMPPGTGIDTSNLDLAQLAAACAGSSGLLGGGGSNSRRGNRRGTRAGSGSGSGSAVGSFTENFQQQFLNALTQMSGESEGRAAELRNLYESRSKLAADIEQYDNDIESHEDELEGESDSESDRAKRIRARISRKKRRMDDAEASLGVISARIALIENEMQTPAPETQAPSDSDTEPRRLDFETPSA